MLGSQRKSLIFLVALVTIHLVRGNVIKTDNQENSNDSKHSLSLGERIEGDRLLDRTEVKRDRHLLRWVEKDYWFPPPGKIYEITLVDVVNLVSDRKGGYPTLKSGGPGSDHVKIHFKSRWNKGLDFEVRVYGKNV